ncbi:DUF2750 domain-containing protein [Rhizobium leguminosarum]|uniref:DUF2750 domain-containing protein n=1 Tax=Rhizobium leguminosarum TaxID=384 RepID=UPI0013C1B7E9|nr:DUF2750 domain-containing protein [Rhizobium leguminosarum]NEJ47278.1 DUF2750 domain-containing protein [Rhizobium leguminosarum]NEJ50050.1 DUF2750 domain-containing protein [Rhizobium leguminosarum]
MSISSINADAFVSEALHNAQGWGIKDKNGFPTSTNASGETAMPFWSSEKRALSVIQSVQSYRGFKPVPIALSEFVNQWLPGLTRDEVYCGLNWSGKGATGYDLPSAEVLDRLTANDGKI